MTPHEIAQKLGVPLEVATQMAASAAGASPTASPEELERELASREENAAACASGCAKLGWSQSQVDNLVDHLAADRELWTWFHRRVEKRIAYARPLKTHE